MCCEPCMYREENSGISVTSAVEMPSPNSRHQPDKETGRWHLEWWDSLPNSSHLVSGRAQAPSASDSVLHTLSAPTLQRQLPVALQGYVSRPWQFVPTPSQRTWGVTSLLLQKDHSAPPAMSPSWASHPGPSAPALSPWTHKVLENQVGHKWRKMWGLFPCPSALCFLTETENHLSQVCCKNKNSGWFRLAWVRKYTQYLFK